jgi:hypothetical protein
MWLALEVPPPRCFSVQERFVTIITSVALPRHDYNGLGVSEGLLVVTLDVQ